MSDEASSVTLFSKFFGLPLQCAMLLKLFICVCVRLKEGDKPTFINASIRKFCKKYYIQEIISSLLFKKVWASIKNICSMKHKNVDLGFALKYCSKK